MATPKSLPSLSVREGFTMLLNDRELEPHQCLTVTAGLVRVAASRLDEDAFQAHPLTLGFLQAGDQLPLDLLRKNRLYLQAIETTLLVDGGRAHSSGEGNSLYDWMLEMLHIRNLSDTEQRIGALLQLLVNRLGHRRGDWYELTVPMTHADLAELCGHNRVTVTRQFSRWRVQGLLEQDGCPQRRLRLAPALMEPDASDPDCRSAHQPLTLP